MKIQKNIWFLTLAALMLIVVALIVVPSVSALNTNVNTLPNKPFVYWLTVIIPEKIDLFFTSNQQDKLIKHTLIAEKRLVEIQELNRINVPVSQLTINNYNGELDKIREMINRGIITSEQARQIIENNLNRVKDREKEIPSDLVPLPIVIGRDSCDGISGQKCQEGYRCVCGFDQDCKSGQVGQCIKGKADDIGDKIICPMIYDPVCGRDGSTYPNECVAKQRGASILKKGQCEEKTKKECKEICLYVGTVNEGMYDSCSKKLIVLKQCDSSDEKPIPNPDPEPPLETCNSDKICQDKYRSCYFICLKGKCGEIMTYVALPDYPACEEVKPTPVPTPGPTPLPPIIKDQCSDDKTCVNTLRNCNAACIDKQCTIVSSFRSRGDYPDCDSYGVL